MKEFLIYNKNINPEELKELNIFISDDSVLEDNVKLYFNCCIMDSTIYSNATIHSNSTIINSVIRTNTNVFSSRIEDSKIGENCSIGPFAHIKCNSIVENDCKISNFAVIKNCYISSDVKISHLVDLNNCEIGKNSKIESGVICVAKSIDDKVLIGDNVLVGANSCLVAPVVISDDAVIDVGSTIIKDVDCNEFATSRNRQTNKPKSNKNL